MKLQKAIISVMLTVLVLLSFVMLAYAQEEKILPSGMSYKEIGDQIEAYVTKNENTTAAMEVAVFNTDGIIYQHCFGYSDIENGSTADNDTVFEWGSASKLLVWVSVMQLWEQGKIDLEADIRTYLPDGFFSNLNYNEPVTMINLMNHDAGFQEMASDLFLKDFNYVLDLEDALQVHEPEQIYEPGTVSAYSNWGTALAGYIVECISGKSYYEYVRENIFEPLGMEHTAISVDLSDNEWVQQQRKLLQCYTSDGVLIPDCFYYISLYPAGMCTGTLGDFAAFAQALLPADGDQSPLFEKDTTLDEMLSPTEYYGDTDVSSNCHGFWTMMYSVPVLGHGGNTVGCSSNLQIDMESGVGVVVMTNQQNENIYNYEMMELIFGSFEDSEYADYNSNVPRGSFRSARTITEGPLSLYSFRHFKMEQSDLKSFWVYTENDGIEKIIMPYGDMLRVSTMECAVMIGLMSLLILGTIYSVITLIAGGVILAPIQRRKLRKQGLPRDIYPFRKWNYLACAMQLLLLANIALLAVQAYAYAPSAHYIWQFVLCGILGLAMAAYISLLVIRWKTLDCTKKEKAKYVITALFMSTSIIAILYWKMYAFWTL